MKSKVIKYFLKNYLCKVTFNVRITKKKLINYRILCFFFLILQHLLVCDFNYIQGK